tara:strand:- start:86 stop:817 length:732 start_codon:yes stop_codon:yes gene_type:complete
LNSELNKRLEIIKKELLVSEGAFIIIANYLRSLGRDLFMINNSLEDDCSTISRSITDSWLCQIESQLDCNHKLVSIASKIISISLQNENLTDMRTYVDKLAEVDASILDGNVKGASNRPVDGLMPCNLPDELRQNVTKIELLSITSPKNWHEWHLRITEHINVVNEFVKLFPASHSFASLPCSLSVILTQINRVIEEQSKLENLLQALTSGQENFDYSSMFGMDVILIKQQLKSIPIIAGDAE